MALEDTLSEILERVKAVEAKLSAPTKPEEKPLTYEEASAFLGLSYETIAKRANRGFYKRVGSPRAWRIWKAELLNPTGKAAK